MYENNKLWKKIGEPIMKKLLMVVFLLVMWRVLAALPAAAQQQYQGYGMGPAAGYGESGMMGHGAYGHGMMYTDDYEEHGPGMMGSGWMNWRKWWPWRDNN